MERLISILRSFVENLDNISIELNTLIKKIEEIMVFKDE